MDEDTPTLAMEELQDDLDYALAMPELYRCRHIERKAADDMAAGEVEENSSASSRSNSNSGGLQRSRRISEKLVDLGRKARDSITVLMGRKDSLLKEENLRDAASQSVRGLTTESFHDQSGPGSHSQSSRDDPLDDVSCEEYTIWPLDTMHLYERDPRRPSLHLTQFQAGEELARKLRACERRGEFRDDVRDAISSARHIETTEERQWEASYDLMRTSAERRQLNDAAFRQGAVPAVDVNGDVTLDDLPFEIFPSL